MPLRRSIEAITGIICYISIYTHMYSHKNTCICKKLYVYMYSCALMRACMRVCIHLCVFYMLMLTLISQPNTLTCMSLTIAVPEYSILVCVGAFLCTCTRRK